MDAKDKQEGNIMLDIATANTGTVGEMAGKQVTGATLEKIYSFVKYYYGKNSQEFELAPLYAKRFFENALVARFENATTLYAYLPDTKSTEYEEQQIYTLGYFAGYLAGVRDTDQLHNEIEIPKEEGKDAPQN